MKWKNLKLGKKFTVAFGSVLLFLAGVVCWSVFGISGIVGNAGQVIDGNKLDGVLANEIKELARQTAEATGEIKTRIDKNQNSIEGTITDIEQVPKVINEVNEVVSTIATAVEEQSVTTKEIAENVAQASSGIGEVTENVTQTTTVAGDIARDIGEVNQSAGEMANSSSQVNLSAGELSKLSEQLKGMVGQFKV